jgi:hypothetical protein
MQMASCQFARLSHAGSVCKQLDVRCSQDGEAWDPLFTRWGFVKKAVCGPRHPGLQPSSVSPATFGPLPLFRGCVSRIEGASSIIIPFLPVGRRNRKNCRRPGLRPDGSWNPSTIPTSAAHPDRLVQRSRLAAWLAAALSHSQAKSHTIAGGQQRQRRFLTTMSEASIQPCLQWQASKRTHAGVSESEQHRRGRYHCLYCVYSCL